MKVIIKAIDLFNKIANGEKLPEKIKFKGDTYYLCEGDLSGSYYFSEKQGFGGVKLIFDTSVMNEEVEIIEEDKKIKKLGHWVDVKTWVKGNDLETGLREQSEFNKNVFYKINEIVDKLNKEE